jgi:hypothetical protein
MQLRRREPIMIQSAWLVRVLASSRRWHHCRDCGGRIFVRAASGRCAICSGRRRCRDEQIDRIVQHQAAAALEEWTDAPTGIKRSA